MITPLLALITANATCTGYLGTNPCQFYAFGRAKQPSAYPYVTWQLIAATPENLIAGTPPVESHRVQIDVWGDPKGAAPAVDTVAAAIRDCLEAAGTLLSFTTDKDTETGAYRISMDFEFWISR